MSWASSPVKCPSHVVALELGPPEADQHRSVGLAQVLPLPRPGDEISNDAGRAS